MVETPQIHVFEKRGLGKAPYQFMGVETLIGPINLGNGMTCGAPGQPMGSCQYCSTGIMYAFWLKSADNKVFYVGSDCIYKSGDAGLRRVVEPIVAAHQKEVRDSRNNNLIALFADYLTKNPTFWADDKRPHPYSYYASKGKTYGDYTQFCYEHAGPSTKAKLARQFLIAANVPLPDKKGAKAKVKAKRDKSVPAPVPIERIIAGRYGNIKIIDMGD